MAEKLTQAEIDALRQAVSEGRVDALEDRKAAPPPAEIKVIDYDFRRPKLLSAERMQSLNFLHLSLIKNIQSLLFSMLKVTGEVSLAALDQVSYGEFLLSLEEPTYLLGMRMDPGSGPLEIEFTSPLAQMLLDLLLGGDGQESAQDSAREFSPLEMDIIRAFSDRFIDELTEAWSTVHDIHFAITNQGVLADQIQIVPPDTPCLCASFLLRVEQVQGRINVCYPFSTLQTVFVQSEEQQDELTDRRANLRKMALAAIESVFLPLQVELGRTRITARQLTQLEVGDVIRLGNRLGETMPLNIAERNIGRSRVGSHRGRLAASVTTLTSMKKKNTADRPPAQPRPSATSRPVDSNKKGTS